MPKVSETISQQLDTVAAVAAYNQSNPYIDAIMQLPSHYADNVAQFKAIAIDVKRDYNASGSDASTTGSIASGSTLLTIAQAKDFKNGQGIVVENAGALTTLTTPTGLSVSTSGTSGTTSYTYSIASVDVYGGMTPVASYTITTGNGTLGNVNFNIISWTPVSNAYAYAIYRTGGTAGNGLINFVNGDANTISDRNFQVITAPFNIPSSPPSVTVSQFLSTTIVSGGGTTSLTLANSAATTVSNKATNHDDTVAIQSALNNGGKIFFPPGTYNVVNRSFSGNFPHCLAIYSNTEIYGNRGKSTIKALMSYITTYVFQNKENILGGHDENIYIHDMVIDGGIPDVNIYVSANAVTFSKTCLALFAKNGAVYPQNIYIENNDFRNACAGGCIFVSIVNGRMTNNTVYNMGRDGLGAFGDTANIVISNNNVSKIGDDGIGISPGIGYIARNIRVIGNYITDSGSRGINVQGVLHIVVGNSIANTALPGIFVNNNDQGQVTSHIIVSNNVIYGAGTYSGGINGWSIVAGGDYGIEVRDYAGSTVNQLADVNVIGNTILNGTKGVMVKGENSSLAINKVNISNNMLENGGLVTVTGVVTPTNITNINNSGIVYRQHGSATITVTAPNTQASAAVNFPIAFGSVPNVNLTLTGTGSSTAGYINIMAFNITSAGFVLVSNSSIAQTITVSWEARVDN